MNIRDEITHELLTIEDYMSAFREVKSRMNWYKKQNIGTIKIIESDIIVIRRNEQ